MPSLVWLRSRHGGGVIKGKRELFPDRKFEKREPAAERREKCQRMGTTECYDRLLKS